MNSKVFVTGIDNNHKQIDVANEDIRKYNLTNIEAKHGHGEELPFEENSFSAVVCLNVLLNIDTKETVEKLIFEMARVCKQNGRILFDFRNALNPLINLKYRLAPYYDHTIREQNLPLRSYRLRYIKKVLKKNNIELVKVRNLGFPHNLFSPIIIIEAEKLS